MQVGERILRLSQHPLEDTLAADRPEVTSRAGLLGWCRRQEPALDGPIDHLQHLESRLSRSFFERNRMRIETAGRGAVVQATVVDRLVERRFDSHRVEDWLEDRAAADDDLVDAIGFPARLVVSHA